MLTLKYCQFCLPYWLYIYRVWGALFFCIFIDAAAAVVVVIRLCLFASQLFDGLLFIDSSFRVVNKLNTDFSEQCSRCKHNDAMQIEMLKICIFYANAHRTMHSIPRTPNISIFINASDIIIHLIEKLFLFAFCCGAFFTGAVWFSCCDRTCHGEHVERYHMFESGKREMEKWRERERESHNGRASVEYFRNTHALAIVRSEKERNRAKPIAFHAQNPFKNTPKCNNNAYCLPQNE